MRNSYMISVIVYESTCTTMYMHVLALSSINNSRGGSYSIHDDTRAHTHTHTHTH